MSFTATQDFRRLRLTLQASEEPPRMEVAKRKPVGRAYAVVSSRGNDDSAWDEANSETLKTRSLYDPDIKGMLAETEVAQESSLRELRTELQHFREVRHSMVNIREQLYGQLYGKQCDVVDYCPQSEVASGERDRAGLSCSTRLYPSTKTGTQTTDGGEEEETETERMREATRRLYGKLQETERRHECERKALEDQTTRHQEQLAEARASLERSEERAADRSWRVEELQRLMTGMEKEHQILAAKMRDSEGQLEDMRAQNQAGLADHHRSLQLEKEVGTLREKICHLNDMLKSQQRKVRQMIEQIGTSQRQIEEKDVLIEQLQERVELLESENREMHDHLEYVKRDEHKIQQRPPAGRSQGLGEQQRPPEGRSQGLGEQQTTCSPRIPLGTKRPKALVRVLETS